MSLWGKIKYYLYEKVNRFVLSIQPKRCKQFGEIVGSTLSYIFPKFLVINIINYYSPIYIPFIMKKIMYYQSPHVENIITPIIGILEIPILENRYTIINKQDQRGETILMTILRMIDEKQLKIIPIYKQYEQLMDKLIENVDLDVYNDKHQTPLIVSAVSCKEKTIIKIFKQKKKLDEHEEVLINIACIRKFKTVMKMFIDKKYNVTNNFETKWYCELYNQRNISWIEFSNSFFSENIENFFSKTIKTKQHNILKYYYLKQFKY